jgi:hypothetical protein
MRIYVVEQCAAWVQPERDGKTATEGLDQSAVLMLFPAIPQVRHLPAFATRPFQGWTQNGFGLGTARDGGAPVLRLLLSRGPTH